MSVSSDPGHFFQTDASAAKAERRAAKRGNKNGDPIDLSSKILAIIPDPLNPDRVYVAESGGYARGVVLEVYGGQIMHLQRPHSSRYLPRTRFYGENIVCGVVG